MNRKQLIIIGGSAGSLEVIIDVVGQLQSSDHPPIILVLHRRSNADSILEDLLTQKTHLTVKEAEEKEYLKPTTIYTAPADYHVLFEQDGSISLDYSEKVNFSRPSIDVAFHSASEIYRDQLVGILLSGANADGAEGLRFVKQEGGSTIAQHPATASVPFMPESAITMGVVDRILTPDEIAAYINSLQF